MKHHYITMFKLSSSISGNPYDALPIINSNDHPTSNHVMTIIDHEEPLFKSVVNHHEPLFNRYLFKSLTIVNHEWSRIHDIHHYYHPGYSLVFHYRCLLSYYQPQWLHNILTLS